MIVYTEIEQDHFYKKTDLIIFENSKEKFIEYLNNIFFEEITILYDEHNQLLISCGGNIFINAFEADEFQIIQVRTQELKDKMLNLLDYENYEFNFQEQKISYNENGYFLNDIYFKTRKELLESFEEKMRLKYE